VVYEAGDNIQAPELKDSFGYQAEADSVPVRELDGKKATKVGKLWGLNLKIQFGRR